MTIFTQIGNITLLQHFYFSDQGQSFFFFFSNFHTPNKRNIQSLRLYGMDAASVSHNNFKRCLAIANYEYDYLKEDIWGSIADQLG